MYRSRHALTKLITIIDADKNTVEKRLGQLDRALTESGKKPVDSKREQIARLIPKRNIETWILYLNEEEVDEDTDYKPTRHNWTELISTAVEALVNWTRLPDQPEICIDSLQHGIKELKRLGF